MTSDGTSTCERHRDVLTVEEAARLLRLNRKSVYQAIALNQFPGVLRVGRVIRIRRATLESWMQNETT